MHDGQKQGVGSMLLELGIRKSTEQDFVQKDHILNTQVSTEERSY